MAAEGRYRNRGDSCLRMIHAALPLGPATPTRDGDAVVILAVHSAIAISDAIRISRTGRKLGADDHRIAVKELKTLCGKSKIDAGGIKHLEWLLGQKARLSYGGERLKADDVVTAVLHARRFATWADTNFPEILRTGGSDV